MTTTFNEGDTIRRSMLRTLPPNSKVEISGSVYTVSGDGLWVGNNFTAPRSVAAGTVRYVGTPVEVTTDRLKQRLRTMGLGEARAASVGMDVVERSLASVGALAPTVLRPGMYVHLYDREMLALLPVGTLLLHGNPEDWNDVGITIVQEHGAYETLLGVRATPHSCPTVYSYPEGTVVEEWRSPRPNEEERIGAFIAAVYEIGVKAKSEAGWCGVFESTISRCGIDEHTIITEGVLATGGFVVDLPISSEALDEALPGTRMEYHESVYVKGSHGNWVTLNPMHADCIPARGGSRAESFTPSALASIRWSPLQIVPGQRVSTVEALQQARVGTKISNYGAEWTKTDADEWTYGTMVANSVRSSDFNADGTRDITWVLDGGDIFDGVVGEPVASFRQMQNAPVGSVISQDSQRWRKGEDNLWTETTYGSSYSPHQFTLGSTFCWNSLIPNES